VGASLVEKCSLIRITPEVGTQVFGGESLSRNSPASTATIAHIDYYHRFDPNLRLLDQPSRLDGRITLRRHTAAQVENRAYRRACYDEPGIIDRVSFVVRDRRTGLIALNLYRVRGSPEFGIQEIETLASMAPLFTVAGSRHVDLLLNWAFDPAVWRQRLKLVCPELTGRELDVAAGLLAGRTLRETSETLGVAHSTVITYRERAYARLGVNNLKKLRGLFATH
jgi:hypothetical protein